MSRQERASWDERFRSGDHVSEEPDPFLAQLDEYLAETPKELKAIDLACGAGRNAIYLAERGWDVTGCDVSIEGLRAAQALARKRGVSLHLFCQDLETVQLPAERFDLVICFFFLDRSLFPQIHAAVRPGGFVVYKTYTTDQSRFPGRPRHSMHMLHPQELLKTFADFRVLVYQESFQGRGVAQLIAQKAPE